MPFYLFRMLIVGPIAVGIVWYISTLPLGGILSALTLMAFVYGKTFLPRVDWFLFKWGFKLSVPIHAFLVLFLIAGTELMFEPFEHEILRRVITLPTTVFLVIWMATCISRKNFGVAITRSLFQFSHLDIHVGQKIKLRNVRKMIEQIVDWTRLARDMGVTQIKLETPNKVLGGSNERNDRLKLILTEAVPGVKFLDIEERRAPFILALAYLVAHGKDVWEEAGTFKRQCQLFKELRSHGFVIQLQMDSSQATSVSK